MEDAEKTIPVAGYAKNEHSPGGSDHLPQYESGEHDVVRGSWSSRFIDSFKRDPNAYATPAGAVGADGKVFDADAAAQATANSPLARHLKGRHLQMIAIGGSIGEKSLRIHLR